jgi:hypothetical protein
MRGAPFCRDKGAGKATARCYVEKAIAQNSAPETEFSVRTHHCRCHLDHAYDRQGTRALVQLGSSENSGI